MLPPLPLDEHHWCQKFELQLAEIWIFCHYFILYLLPSAIVLRVAKPFADDFSFFPSVLAGALLEVAHFFQIDGGGLFVSEVAELPIVDDLDLWVVGAVGEWVDEARAVGRNVDAWGVVDLLNQGVSLSVLFLLFAGRSAPAFVSAFQRCSLRLLPHL